MALATVVAPQAVTNRDNLTAPLSALRQLEALTGLPFLCLGAERGLCFSASDVDLPPYLSASMRVQCLGAQQSTVFKTVDGLTVYAVPLPSPGESFVAVGYLVDDVDAVPTALREVAYEAAWSEERLSASIKRQPRCAAGPLLALLRLANEKISADPVSSDTQLVQLSEQLDQTYEEVALLHALTRNLQVSRSPAELVSLCLDRMPGLIDAEFHLVQLRAPGESTRIWTNGDFPFPLEDAEELLGRLDLQESSRPIVRNFVQATPLAARFPGLKNFVAVPVREARHRFGWIVSGNLSRDREFGTVEANFLNTIATILGTHVRNIDLMHEQNDLLIGFVRSFVSTLDAKDPYTRGHSERVALIARRIGEEMGLADEMLKTIYLSGLLHDVGKIGVDDSILRKNGPLTDAEFAQVKKHPTIGYNILLSLKNLRHVLPGVRNHHESYDGRGYPDGLAGDDIPLLARILAVADAYDAMGSDRPYRKGMPAEKIDSAFRNGHNVQWDGTVLDSYFACSEDILSICAAYSLEHGRAFGDN